jgi:hypothetical protein
LDVPVVQTDAVTLPDATDQSAVTSAPAIETTAIAPAPELAQASVDAAVAAALAEVSANSQASAPPLAQRPQPRPADLTSASGAAEVAADPAIAEIDPSAIPAGTILAQFDAYQTPELARAKFAQLQESFGALMTGKAMVVQSAQINGRAAFRLRVAGLGSQAEAQSFCAALQAEGTECVPLAQR